MAHDVFVSHSVKDKLVATAVVARLEADSISCWVAPRDVVPGADWGESIVNAIESSRIMILVFSQSANDSPQIKREVERAVDKEVYIIPFRVDNIKPTKSLKYFISTPQWMDAFPPPLEQHLDHLAKTVKAILAGRPPPRPPAPPPPSPQPTPVRSRTWTVAAAALLVIAGGAWYFFTHRTTVPVIPQPEPTPQLTGAIAPPTAPPAATLNRDEEELTKQRAKEAADAAAHRAQLDDELEQARKIKEEAQRRLDAINASATIAAPPASTPAVPQIAGVWHDGYNPNNVSQITQNGASFTFTRAGVLLDGTPFKSSGGGTISGLRIQSRYNATWYSPWSQTSLTSSGTCTGSVSADGAQMELTCRDSYYGYSSGEAYRE